MDNADSMIPEPSEVEGDNKGKFVLRDTHVDQLKGDTALITENKDLFMVDGVDVSTSLLEAIKNKQGLELDRGFVEALFGEQALSVRELNQVRVNLVKAMDQEVLTVCTVTNTKADLFKMRADRGEVMGEGTADFDSIMGNLDSLDEQLSFVLSVVDERKTFHNNMKGVFVGKQQESHGATNGQIVMREKEVGVIPSLDVIDDRVGDNDIILARTKQLRERIVTEFGGE